LTYERINQHSLFIFGSLSVRALSIHNAQMDFSLSVPECPLYHHFSLMRQLVHLPPPSSTDSSTDNFHHCRPRLQFRRDGQFAVVVKSPVYLRTLTSLAHWSRLVFLYAGFLFLVATFLLFHIFAQIVRVPSTR